VNVTVNGEFRVLDEGSTLAELLDTEIGNRRGTAAAVDGEVVPRGDWASFALADGQSVELLTAVQGG
jgi:sulfur carrier protein